MNAATEYKCGTKPRAEEPCDPLPDDEGVELDIGTAEPLGDPGWLEAHAELPPLHKRKSATYGHSEDSFANFTATEAVTGKPPEYAVALRMVEKLVRVVNMIDAGAEGDVREWLDLSSLALIGEALRRRRL